MKRKNNLNSKKKKLNWGKLFLPLLITVLFVGSSIAYFMYLGFSFGNPNDKISKDIEKYLSDSKSNYLVVKRYGESDFYYIYYIFLSKENAVPFYVTKDGIYFSRFAFDKLENDDVKSIKLALSQFSPIIPNDYSLIEIINNSQYYYKVYKVSKSSIYYKDLKNIYFLVGNSSILIAFENPYK